MHAPSLPPSLPPSIPRFPAPRKMSPPGFEPTTYRSRRWYIFPLHLSGVIILVFHQRSFGIAYKSSISTILKWGGLVMFQRSEVSNLFAHWCDGWSILNTSWPFKRLTVPLITLLIDIIVRVLIHHKSKKQPIYSLWKALVAGNDFGVAKNRNPKFISIMPLQMCYRTVAFHYTRRSTSHEYSRIIVMKAHYIGPYVWFPPARSSSPPWVRMCCSRCFPSTAFQCILCSLDAVRHSISPTLWLQHATRRLVKASLTKFHDGK